MLYNILSVITFLLYDIGFDEQYNLPEYSLV